MTAIRPVVDDVAPRRAAADVSGLRARNEDLLDALEAALPVVFGGESGAQVAITTAVQETTKRRGRSPRGVNRGAGEVGFAVHMPLRYRLESLRVDEARALTRKITEGLT